MASPAETKQESVVSRGGGGGYVLLLPYPSQGHVHPMLQFAKRLAHHGLRPTLAVTRHILATCTPDAAAVGNVRLAAVSDGCDAGGFGECNDVTAYLSLLEAAGSDTLGELLRAERDQGRPVRAVVYDVRVPPLGARRGPAARRRRRRLLHPALRRQRGLRPRLVRAGRRARGGRRHGGAAWAADAGARGPAVVPQGRPRPLPRLLRDGHEPVQGAGPSRVADDVLVNSFFELEPEEAAYMATAWRAKTIGPTVPASYVGDDRLPSDTKYGFHLFELTAAPCVSWLSTHPARSVVFASFGSLSNLDPAEMREVAHGLLDAGRPFLWAVRSSEAHKLPAGYGDAIAARGGMVVSWCPQLEVLAQPAVGCFLTHCGWNSTSEALVAGVPMVALPQWTDQPMNAKYVEAVWRAGVRVRPAAADGLARRGEVAAGIRDVMDGERSGEFRRNAAAWAEKARAASLEGGSSDRNIAEFVAKYGSNDST